MSEKRLNNVLNKLPDTMPAAACDLQGRARMRTTQHAGCTVQWREWGPQDGIPLVALHGGHGSWLHWLGNVDAFANKYRVLLPDMPGFGDSTDLDLPARDPARLDALVQALKHGIEPDDAMYVVEHPLRDIVLREDPLKVLYLGISPDGLPWRWWWPTHRGGRRSSMRCA